MKKTVLKQVIILILFFLLLFLFLFFFRNIGKAFYSRDVNKKGISYVKKEESKDVAAIMATVKEMQKTELANPEDFQDKINEWNSLLDQGQVPLTSDEEMTHYNSKFSDTIFFGDSLTEAIYSYQLVNSSSIIYERGASLKKLEEYIPQIAGTYPKNVVVFTGLNDHPVTEPPAEYLERYRVFLQALKTQLPDSSIFVLSILPATEEGVSATPKLIDTTEIDAGLSTLCHEVGTTYIDTTWIVRPDLYEPDGTHFTPYFYAVLFRYLDNLFL
ncbi:hypothetical protein M2454_000844 [Aequitasia blattaphilus]|uniref:SGNH hydrolase-type esterase domain-containing protein n=1 Tax=Aequitasia blattaphilus TaxID=2949332 RepID=A0ABT1EDJ9_9FIRM|nr:GDSL-type esterase/lipase family protein [Aequitasia blattaphilus]MCP1102547.1 hypothetical protein [Aequitasia blattaphilus]MCR8615187.1 hypothetical protein [Aequitasia blattaphilus]